MRCDRLGVLDRIPKHADAACPFVPRLADCFGRRREFIRRLERRIDQNEPTPLDRRKQGLEPRITVHLEELYARIKAEIGPKV